MSKPPTQPGAYAVGYGKPPLATRFKPGQSGNPRGRPKREPSLAELVQQESRRAILVTEDGAVRKMSKRNALAKRLMQQALKGDARATQHVIELLNVASAAAEGAAAAHHAEHASDLALMQSLVLRMEGLYRAPGDPSATPEPAATSESPSRSTEDGSAHER